MGSRIFDFLADSFLFQDDLIDEQFARTPLSEIEGELERYREFCIQNQADLMAEIDGGDSSLALYADERFSISELTQAALYVRQYVLQDPLLRFTAKRSESAKALTKASDFPSLTDGVLQLDELSRTIKTMKALTPMVAGDFVKFAPSSLASEDPAEIPIYASDNYFEDALPAEILRVFKKAAQVSTVMPDKNGYIDLRRLEPCRRIRIEFAGDLDGHGFIYTLHQIGEATKKNGQENEIRVRLTMPSTPPESAYFRAWVQQSVNLAARRLFRETYDAAALATGLNIRYSTHSALRFNALRKAMKPDTAVPIHTANTFLNLDLPFINEIDVERLMQIRREEGEAFHNFRVALDDKLSSLREVSDPQTAKRMASDAVCDLTEAQLHDVQLKFRSLREKMGLAAFGSLVTLAAAVQNQGFGLLSAAVAAVPIGTAIVEYRKDVKRHPAFFLWKVLSKKSRRLAQN
jgi:hypothetical protein